MTKLSVRRLSPSERRVFVEKLADGTLREASCTLIEFVHFPMYCTWTYLPVCTS